jgi:DNA-binding NarL/FixJ family response regulator
VSVLRVVIADDEAMVRAGLRLLIEGEPDLEVVGEATDGEAAVAQVAALAPDVVLMDVRMPRLNGLEAARRVVESGSSARVVVLTTFDEDEVVDLAMRHGVAGFLLKSSPPEDLVDAIRRAGAGHGSLDPAVVPGIIERYRQGARAVSRAPELDQLTAREREVLALVGRGYSNAEIAARLFLGETTVKTHLGRVLDKLGLRDRPRAIAFAYESGLIRAGSEQDGP